MRRHTPCGAAGASCAIGSLATASLCGGLARRVLGRGVDLLALRLGRATVGALVGGLLLVEDDDDLEDRVVLPLAGDSDFEVTGGFSLVVFGMGYEIPCGANGCVPVKYQMRALFNVRLIAAQALYTRPTGHYCAHPHSHVDSHCQPA
jgi:hypothetical protein